MVLTMLLLLRLPSIFRPHHAQDSSGKHCDGGKRMFLGQIPSFSP